MDANNRRRTTGEHAAAWFVLLRSDALKASDREEFVAWLRESELHVAEMLRLMKIHNALRGFHDWHLVSRSGPSEASNVVPLSVEGARLPQREGEANGGQRGPWHSRTALRRRLQVGAIAASVGALLLGALYFFSNASGELIQTQRGERREVALVDGSLLEIAPESRVRVKFERWARHVALEQGRVVFRVASNPNRPFSVLANETTIRAVGTAFGVERDEQGVRVTVAEGKVAVLGPGTEEPGAPGTSGRDAGHAEPLTRSVSSSSASPSRLLLKAGEQVRVSNSGVAEAVREVDGDRELAWARGRLIFEKETLLRAVATFNRYNRIQMRVMDAQLAERVVTGIFDAADPESFIAFIQTDARVRVVRRDASEILISRLD